MLDLPMCKGRINKRELLLIEIRAIKADRNNPDHKKMVKDSAERRLLQYPIGLRSGVSITGSDIKNAFDKYDLEKQGGEQRGVAVPAKVVVPDNAYLPVANGKVNKMALIKDIMQRHNETDTDKILLIAEKRMRLYPDVVQRVGVTRKDIYKVKSYLKNQGRPLDINQTNDQTNGRENGRENGISGNGRVSFTPATPVTSAPAVESKEGLTERELLAGRDLLVACGYSVVKVQSVLKVLTLLITR